MAYNFGLRIGIEVVTATYSLTVTCGKVVLIESAVFIEGSGIMVKLLMKIYPGRL